MKLFAIHLLFYLNKKMQKKNKNDAVWIGRNCLFLLLVKLSVIFVKQNAEYSTIYIYLNE